MREGPENRSICSACKFKGLGMGMKPCSSICHSYAGGLRRKEGSSDVLPVKGLRRHPQVTGRRSRSICEDTQ